MHNNPEFLDSNIDKIKVLSYRVAEHELSRIWKLFEESKIQTILIKGWAASQYYPTPYERHLGDFDIAVSPNEFEEAQKVINDNKLLKVDLHKGLRHLDTAKWEDLINGSELIKCDQSMVRVLRPEIHLRVICVHWLTDGGEYQGKLWDVYHLLTKTGKKFDWEFCFNGIGQNRRRWITITVGLVCHYLGLKPDNLPFPPNELIPPGWILRFLEKEWKSGYRLIPIHFVMGNKGEIWKQIKKRIPPNPIQATIDIEGSLDSKFQIHYQLGSFVKRVLPSFRRILERFKITD